MTQVCVDWFIRATADPWSEEMRTVFAIGAGLALGLLVVGGGTTL